MAVYTLAISEIQNLSNKSDRRLPLWAVTERQGSVRAVVLVLGCEFDTKFPVLNSGPCPWIRHILIMIPALPAWFARA